MPSHPPPQGSVQAPSGRGLPRSGWGSMGIHASAAAAAPLPQALRASSLGEGAGPRLREEKTKGGPAGSPRADCFFSFCPQKEGGVSSGEAVPRGAAPVRQTWRWTDTGPRCRAGGPRWSGPRFPGASPAPGRPRGRPRRKCPPGSPPPGPCAGPGRRRPHW